MQLAKDILCMISGIYCSKAKEHMYNTDAISLMFLPHFDCETFITSPREIELTIKSSHDAHELCRLSHMINHDKPYKLYIIETMYGGDYHGAITIPKYINVVYIDARLPQMIPTNVNSLHKVLLTIFDEACLYPRIHINIHEIIIGCPSTFRLYKLLNNYCHANTLHIRLHNYSLAYDFDRYINKERFTFIHVNEEYVKDMFRLRHKYCFRRIGGCKYIIH